MTRSIYRQSFAAVFAVLLINHAVADQLLPGLMQVATQEILRNWGQSRARRSLVHELSEQARSFGNELSAGAHSMATSMAVSPFLLPLWLPAFLLGSAFVLSSVVPKVLPSMVKAFSPILTQTSMLLGAFGFDEASRVLEPRELNKLLQPGELLERGLDLLDVRHDSCRRKMFCEVGSYTLDKQPALARFIDLFSDTLFRAVPNYSEPLSRGIRGSDCDRLFKQCEVSPFGKMMNYYLV